MPDPRESCGPYEPIEANDVERDMEFSSENHDTIGMIILDRNGKLVAGTSTNGARFKIPGYDAASIPLSTTFVCVRSKSILMFCIVDELVIHPFQVNECLHIG